MATTRFWLCADDYGISRAVDHGIRDLISRGRINATSVMVAAPAFDAAEAAALKRLRDAGRAAVGLHITLTAPFSPLTRDFAPTGRGFFLPLAALLAAALARRLDGDKLRREIDAQLAAFAGAFGTPPDFVDGHQHVQLFPQIRDAALDAVARHAPNTWVRQCGRAPARLVNRLADRKGLLLDVLSVAFRRRAQRRGLRTNPAFAGTYDFESGTAFADLFPAFLDHLPEDGVVMCHPGFVDDALRALDPVTARREEEFAYFSGEAFPALLAARGVGLAQSWPI